MTGSTRRAQWQVARVNIAAFPDDSAEPKVVAAALATVLKRY